MNYLTFFLNETASGVIKKKNFQHSMLCGQDTLHKQILKLDDEILTVRASLVDVQNLLESIKRHLNMVSGK